MNQHRDAPASFQRIEGTFAYAIGELPQCPQYHPTWPPPNNDDTLARLARAGELLSELGVAYRLMRDRALKAEAELASVKLADRERDLLG